MKCIYCEKEIPKERLENARRGKGHLKKLKYCSTICIKRAWHYKNKPLKDNYLDSATYKGRRWELYVLDKLDGSIDCNKKVFGNKGYDIIHNDKKIDVKSKECRLNKGYKEWSFSRENKNTDHYLCLCLLDDKVLKSYLIPEDEFGKSGITIGFNSIKFKKFELKL